MSSLRRHRQQGKRAVMASLAIAAANVLIYWLYYPFWPLLIMAGCFLALALANCITLRQIRRVRSARRRRLA